MILPSRLLATATDAAADESAMRTIDARWNEYLKTQNHSAIGAIHAPDAIPLPPHMPRVTGTEPARRFWAGIRPLKANAVLAPGTIRVSGGWGIDPTAQGDQKDNKTGLGWRAVPDIWSSHNPPPHLTASQVGHDL